MNKSPSDFSCQSYEMFVGGQAAPADGRSAGGPAGGNGHGPDGDYSIREKMSIKSDDVDSLLGGGNGNGNVSDSRMKINGRVRKVFSILFFPFFIVIWPYLFKISSNTMEQPMNRNNI